MKIRNINGTSQTTCKCGSWLKHWEKFSGQSTPTYCPVTSCQKKDLVGAHVQKFDSSDKKWYIYPLCSAHNQSTGDLEVLDSKKLVSANKKETCEKQAVIGESRKRVEWGQAAEVEYQAAFWRDILN